MQKNIIRTAIVLLCSCFLISCGTEKVNYKKGLPEGDNPALLQFFRSYVTENDGQYLLENDQESIYSQVASNSSMKETRYYAIPHELLKEHFKPLFESENPKHTFKQLTFGDDSTKTLKEFISIDQYNLPKVTLQAKNLLTIETSQNKKTFDLLKILQDYGLTAEDELIVNVDAVDDQAMIINIENTASEGSNQFVDIFIKQDLSHFVTTSSFYEPYRESILSGKLKDFESLVKKEKLNDRLTLLNDSYGVFDSEKNKVYSVNEADYLSGDGKYVYLDGKKDKLADGVQRIQKIEDYFAKNKDYEAEFNISYKEIAKELELVTGGVSSADIYYFDKDLVILSLSFSGIAVGTAGYSNVIIDLQEDKNNPKIYIVDLDLH